MYETSINLISYGKCRVLKLRPLGRLFHSGLLLLHLRSLIPKYSCTYWLVSPVRPSLQLLCFLFAAPYSHTRTVRSSFQQSAPPVHSAQINTCPRPNESETSRVRHAQIKHRATRSSPTRVLRPRRPRVLRTGPEWPPPAPK